MTTKKEYRTLCQALVAHVARRGSTDRYGHDKNYSCYWLFIESAASGAIPKKLRLNRWWELAEMCFRFRCYPTGHNAGSYLATATARARRGLCLSRARRAGDSRVPLAEFYETTSGQQRKNFRNRHHKALSAIGAFAPANQSLDY